MKKNCNHNVFDIKGRTLNEIPKQYQNIVGLPKANFSCWNCLKEILHVFN